MTAYFPLFLDLREKRFLMFGAGQVAARRMEGLLRYGAVVTAVAPHISQEVEGLCIRYPKQLVIEQRAYRRSEIQDGSADFVLAATDDKEVNALIFRECRHKGIPVNNASDRRQCDFYFPALVERDNLVIGVTSTDGSHRMVAQFCDRLRQEVSDV